MAWPIHVHSIESDKAWQMALARPAGTFAQPMSREVIFLSGHVIANATAMTTAKTRTEIVIRDRIDCVERLSYNTPVHSNPLRLDSRE